MSETIIRSPVLRDAVATADFVEYWAAHAGSRLAVADARRELTFAELNAAANRIAWALAARQVRGPVVPICLPPSTDLMVAAIGVQKAGLAFSYTDPRLAEAGLRERLTHLGTDCALGDARTLPRLAEAAPGIALLDAMAAAGDPALRCDDPGIRAAPGDIAYVRYTSGSTGSPKGVVYTHATMLGTGSSMRQTLWIGEGDRIGFVDAFWPTSKLATLEAGASAHFLSLATGGPASLAALIRRHGVTLLSTFPSAFRQFALTLDELRQAGEDVTMPTLERVQLGGEPLTAEDVAAARRLLPPGCRLVNGYSSSELVAITSHLVPDVLPPGPAVPVGRAAPGNEILLLDPDGAPVPPGEAGEIAVRTRHPPGGYWRRPDLTERVFGTTTPTAATTLYRTGDVGRFDAAGLLWLVGRVDNQIKLRGNRILPEEIEGALLGHPSVTAAAVRTFEDPRSGSLRLAAFVVGCESEAELRALRAWAHEQLPDYMVPRAWIPLAELPRTATGKLDRRALPDPTAFVLGQEGAGKAAAAEASAASREAVARAWRAVLGAASLESGLSFDEAGGDSLRLMHLVLLLERFVGREIPLECVHPAMRPSEMAAALDAPPPEASRAGPDGVAVFMLPGLGGDEPALAALRAACAPALPFHPIRWPEAAELRAAPGRADRLREAVLAQVAAAAPDGPLGLVGYSFGGSVAHALARRLIAAGRDVRFVCLLDSEAPGLPPPPAPDTSLRRLYWDLRHMLAGREIGLGGANRLALHIVARVRPDARLLHAALARPWPGTAGLLQARLRLRLAERLRVAAFLAWQAEDAAAGTGPLDLPVTLLRAAQGAAMAEDLGWKRFCTRLAVVPVEGDHYSMLGPAGRRTLADALLRAAAA